MKNQYSEALGIPLIPCPTTGENYHIDIEQNRQWEEDRCRNTGLISYFPLWQADRKNGTADMTLDEINEEINASRRERGVDLGANT